MEKKYVKPVIEIVELRPEEQIGACGQYARPNDNADLKAGCYIASIGS